MKNKTILGLFVAVFAIVFVLSTVLASDFATINEVEVNGIDINGFTSVGQVSDIVPVEVKFTATSNVTERVKVKVYIEGYKDEISDSVILRTPLEDGVTYKERFSLKLPSTFDLDDLSEDLDLTVRFSAKSEDSFEESYALRMQKDLYSLNILSIEAPSLVTSGDTFAVDVVVENNGYERLDNVYVVVSVSDLGISRKVYFGDIDSDRDTTYDEIRDAVNKRIYLTAPRNAPAGTYEVEVEAYNYDGGVFATTHLIVNSAESSILPTVTSRAIAVGEETTFDVVLVNPNDRMVVYSITPEESSGLVIEIEEPIITVLSDSSRTVKINVKATDSAEEGTHVVRININSESGLERQVSFTVNVEDSKTSTGTTNTVFVLTVILAIIFVVLLIILIVLLTKRPEEEPEEFGETSYY